jgi:D-amino-acid dehydrogenase
MMAAMEDSTLVIGAGVVGLSVAHHLLRAGHRVTVLDPAPPGEGGASWGNSGLVSAALVAPLSQPGALRQVPRWLMDPLGPLAIRPAHLPRALPWLLRWARAGSTPARAERASDAIQALHRDAFAVWREMVGDDAFGRLIRATGAVVGFEGPPSPPGIEATLRRRHGIAAEPLDRAALERLYPGIAPSVQRGLLLPGQGHMLDPGALLAVLAERLRGEGAAMHRERALQLERDGEGWRVATNLHDRAAARVVVCAGIWSRGMLARLGLKLPLLAERGYHAELPALPDGAVPLPISFRARGLAITPMEGRLRASGTVEIAAAEAPPDLRRARLLARQARAIFPHIPAGEPKLWMGPRPGLPDGLPAFGPVGPPGLFVCCGHGHFGMTSGPPSARALARIMAGEVPQVDLSPYAPHRFG